ncbi:MAG: amino acid ABC transporter permease, partial [Fusobacteriaceae bacterium]
MQEEKRSFIRKIFFREEEEIVSRGKGAFNYFIVILFFVGVMTFAFKSISYNYSWKTIIETYYYKFLLGFSLTLFISFFSLLMSLGIGTIIALGSRNKFLPYYYFSKIYTEIIRGTPLIVQIFLFFYVRGTAVRIENRYFMGILIMATFSGAYVSEIIRAGIESIEASQMETAKALAFTRFQTYRYIIFPQVIKRVMPPLAGQFASLIKDSSLLSIIAVNEFTKNVQEVDSLTFSPIENYCILAVGYLILTYPISHLSK